MRSVNLDNFWSLFQLWHFAPFSVPSFKQARDKSGWHHCLLPCSTDLSYTLVIFFLILKSKLRKSQLFKRGRPCTGRYWTFSSSLKPFVPSTHTIVFIFVFPFFLLWLQGSEKKIAPMIPATFLSSGYFQLVALGGYDKLDSGGTSTLWLLLPAAPGLYWTDLGEGSPLGSGARAMLFFASRDILFWVSTLSFLDFRACLNSSKLFTLITCAICTPLISLVLYCC